MTHHFGRHRERPKAFLHSREGVACGGYSYVVFLSKNPSSRRYEVPVAIHWPETEAAKAHWIAASE